MLIKRLKLSGFKSFVDPTELHIEPGLTGIVGPNGCGKSNLLEAIRWVMGENSAKSMRGGGMSDVIFAGTERRPARDFAEVTLLAERQAGEIVHLLDASGKTVVSGQELASNDDDPELEIVRRIERDAGSAYRANGRDVRAKDIALIFADAATGAHSPALVSQGRIAAAIAAKPTERRQMLEEAAGISGLHVRRKDAEQKLRAAENNMARLDDIMADQDARAAHLRKQARAAERYKKLSEAILTAEARLIYARWRDAKAAADSAKQEASAAEQRVNAEQEKLLAAQTEQKLLTNQLADIRVAVEQSRQRNSDATHRIATLTSQRQTMLARLHDLERQAARIAEDRGREDRLTLDAVAALDALTDEAKALKNTLASLEKQQPEYQAAYENAERAVRETEVELARATAESARIEADIRVADNMLAAAVRQAEQLKQAKARLESQRQGLGDLAAMDKSIEQRRSELAKLADNIGKWEEAQQANAARQEDAAAQRQQNEAALSSAKAKLSGLTSERSALERDLAIGQSDNKAIDHIRVTKGYEKALAAALGNDLDAAIGNDDGGADYYWSDTVAANSDAPQKNGPKKNDPPKGSQPLADFVSAAPAALSVRLAALFIVDQDDGQPLAPGQRLVTKDGAMRRWDGLVSRSGHSGAAQRMERQNRLNELNDIIAEADNQVAAAQAELDASLSQLEALREEHATLRTQLQQARQNERESLRILDAAEFERGRTKERIAEIKSQYDELAQSDTETQTALATAQDQRAALPDGSAQAEALANVKQQSAFMRTALQQAQAALAGHEQERTRLRERRAVVQAEIRGWEARSGEADQRLRDLTKRAEEIAAEQAKLADEPERLEQEAALAEQDSSEIADTLARQESTLSQTEQAVRIAEQASAAAGEAMAQAREQRAAAATRAENSEMRRVEMGRISGERFECPPPLLPERAGFDADDVSETSAESAQLEHLTASRERLGPVNLVAADELEELELETATARQEHQELITAIGELRGSISSLNREGRARLKTAFEEVDNHFQRLFVRLFDGGKAHLAMIDSDDPLEAGLEIMAQPPGKKLSSLTLLSGGEQALTAIALIFGLFLTNPAPICVLDEVDAPLDDANIDRFCDLLDQMVRETDTRYLIVTHNAVTMSRMHRLFGVTMIEKGISRLVSVDLGGAEELLAAE